MDDHGRTGDGELAPLPRLVLYSRPGCHLCDDARAILQGLLAERAAAGRDAPEFEEVDITTDAELERAFFTTIPVVEYGTERLELATSAGRLRRLLEEGSTITATGGAAAVVAVD